MKYNKLTDVFSAWADAAGKSMPRWEEYDKVIRKRYGSNIDTEYDLFDVIRNKWKMQWKMPTPEEEIMSGRKNHINEIRNAGKKYVK